MPRAAPLHDRRFKRALRAPHDTSMNDAQPEVARRGWNQWEVTPVEQRFGIFVNEWLADQRVRLRPSTLQGYSAVVRLYLLPAFGELELGELSTRRIQNLYADLLSHPGRRGWPLSPRTVRQCHAVLSRVLDAATLQGLLERNPAWGAAVPRDDFHRFEPTVWSPEEVAQFVELVEGHYLAGLFKLAIATGMRRSELLGLTPPDVKGNQVTVRWALTEQGNSVARFRPKTRKPRVLTIDDDTALCLERQRLRELLKPDQGLPWRPFFSDADGHFVRPAAVTSAFRRLIERSSLPRIRFHDLRHTHASLLLAAGIPMHVVSARLGHAPQTTLLYYAHVLPPSDQLAAASYGAMVSTGMIAPRHPEAGTWTEASAAAYRNMWAWKKKAAHRNSTSRSKRSVWEG